MFQVGEYIYHGSHGVCKVMDIGRLDIPGLDKDKLYYTLEPIQTPKGKIFFAVDNNKTVTRPILTKEEAMELIEQIKDLEELEVKDEKNRAGVYKEALKTCDCKEMVRIIKTTYLRKKSRTAAGKKNRADDEKYFKMAEEALHTELSISLQMSKEEVKEFITAQVV